MVNIEDENSELLPEVMTTVPRVLGAMEATMMR
jgi:hypothetical protein